MAEPNEINPYAAPIAAVKLAPHPTGVSRVEGDCVVVTSLSVLPMRCVSTNQACNHSDQTLRKFSYAPSFQLVLNRKICRLSRCLSPQSRRQNLLFRVIMSFAFFFLFWFLVKTGIFAAVVPIVYFFSAKSDRLRVVKHKNGEFWVKGFHLDFLNSLVTKDRWPRV